MFLFYIFKRIQYSSSELDVRVEGGKKTYQVLCRPKLAGKNWNVPVDLTSTDYFVCSSDFTLSSPENLFHYH